MVVDENINWLTVTGFPDYEANQCGQIRRKKDLKEPCQILHKGHGLKIDLIKDGKRYNVLVKKIIAKLFLGDPTGKKNILHHDLNAYNCAVWNLYYSNSQRRGSRGYGLKGEQCNFHVLKDEQIAFILLSKLTSYRLAKMFNVSWACIKNIRTGKSWPHFQRLNEGQLASLANNHKIREGQYFAYELADKTAYSVEKVKTCLKVAIEEKSKIPVRIDSRTVIYINRGENPQKAIEKFKQKLLKAS